MNNSNMLNISNLTKLCSCVIIGSSLMITACGGNDSSNDNLDPIDTPINDDTMSNEALNIILKSSEWTLINAKDVQQNPISALNNIKDQVTLNFNATNGEDALGFDVGCNSNGASYSLSGDNLLDAKSILSTEMFCSDLDSAENSLESFFREQISISLKKSANQDILVMKTYDGRTLQWQGTKLITLSEENKVLLKELKQYRWQLLESSDEKIQTSLDISADVNASYLNIEHTAEKKLSYSLGCNKFTGGFTLGDNTTLKSTKIINTEKSCNQTLMDAEESLAQLMLKGSSLSIKGTGASTASVIKPIMTQKVNNSVKTTLKWQGTQKTYTAKVEGKVTKRNTQSVEVLREETKIVNNINFTNGEFCNTSNIYNYGFLHAMLSNYFEETCEYDGNSNVIYTAYAPDTKQTYSYHIGLTEIDY